MSKPFYISTTIPYVNGDPHLGHALEYIQADAVARYQRLLGKDVFYLSGTDENALKNVRAAQEAGEGIEDFIDRNAAEFEKFEDLLNLSLDDFINTTEDRHFKGAQKLWRMCEDDIYKKEYEGLYCVGCERFYKEDELEDGKCPDHKVEPEEVQEENYFFNITKYQDELRELLESSEVEVFPEYRKNEALQFIANLEDFSISRTMERAEGWGVPVPGDDSQVMYVWFDALSNYINALGFAEDSQMFEKYWVQGEDREVVHFLGKDVSRFHLVYWLGMLISADLPLPTEEYVHGFMSIDGEPMSKSRGIFIDPFELVDDYGVDPVRYYMLGAIPAHEDGDFTHERFEEYYNAHLANGVGNLTSRILSMVENYNDGKVPAQAGTNLKIEEFWQEYQDDFSQYKFDEVVENINNFVTQVDGLISEEKVWDQAKKDKDVSDNLYVYTEALRHIAVSLLPIVPEAAEEILDRLGMDVNDLEDLKIEQEWGRLDEGIEITSGEALFERIN